jgi:isopentenyl-diphosphate delta-isomerase
MAHRRRVSNAAEPLVLVDDEDREIGFASKHDCHAGAGTLHRAFSIFIFNDNGELLLQQRGAAKPLWPNYWSNTCCSHPRAGETMDQATERRLVEEVGIRCPLRFLYKFKYHAAYEAVGAEREFCWVYIGYHGGQPDVNLDEISDWRFVDVASLDAELERMPERFTPWFKLEWTELKANYLDEILSGARRAARLDVR